MRRPMRLLVLCTSLHILTNFCLHHSGALRPAALLCNCSQGLVDQLRLNKILTSLNLEHQNICDEKVKAPAGQTAASRAEGAGVGRGSTEGARCLTMRLHEFAVASCQLCRPSLRLFVSTRPSHTSTWAPTNLVTRALRRGHRSAGGFWNNGTQSGDDCSAAEVLYEA